MTVLTEEAIDLALELLRDLAIFDRAERAVAGPLLLVFLAVEAAFLLDALLLLAAFLAELLTVFTVISAFSLPSFSVFYVFIC